MRKLLLSLALVCLSMSAFAQEPAEAKTEVNQYGQKVDAIPVDATVQDGILVLQNKTANYKMWFDVRIQADATVYFGAPDFCAKEIDGKSNTSHIGNGMSIRRARFAVFTHTTLTDKYIDFLTRNLQVSHIGAAVIITLLNGVVIVTLYTSAHLGANPQMQLYIVIITSLSLNCGAYYLPNHRWLK